MSDLLADALAAHGGLERWNQLRAITVDAEISGVFWQIKGPAEAMAKVRFEVDTQREWLTMDFVGQERRSVFEPDRVVVQQPIGTVIATCDNRERSFDGHQFETPWDEVHLAYFTGEALWTYLTVPFQFIWPGFQSVEISPIDVDGETWRRLQVTFPDHIKSHTRTHVFCLGPDGLLRRHDFTIDVVGHTVESQLYASGYLTSMASASPPLDAPTHRWVTRKSSSSPSTWATSPSADPNASLEDVTMNTIHPASVVTRAEWEAARRQLLAKEQDLTRARDTLAAARRRMPWLKVDQEYLFVGPNGTVRLPDLFGGSRQLLLHRAFFEPEVSGWPDHACVGCSLTADQVAHLAHLHTRDNTLAFASRALQPDSERLKARMGWSMPCYTITDSFDVDFGVADWYGTNAFIRDGDVVYRAYFIDGREHEPMGGTLNTLDVTALGRQEDWEDSPEGYPAVPRFSWLQRHDKYTLDRDEALR